MALPAAVPAAVLAAVLAVQVMNSNTTASAGVRPPAHGLLPSVPGVPLPPVPTVTGPPLPTAPTPTVPVPVPPVPGLPGLPQVPGQPGQPAQPGVPAVPGAEPAAGPGSGGAPPDTGDPAVVTADEAASIIANYPAADLYPQPRVDPATTVQSQLVARLGEMQHRIQYVRNVLTRTRADLAVAQAQLDATAMLITLLTAPASGAINGPRDRVLALSAAIASAEADLSHSEAAVRSLQQQVNSGVQTTLAGAQTSPAAAAANYGGGRLRRPVPGRIGSPYGNRFDPYYHVWQLHAGVDMVASFGSDIVAAATGTVVRAAWAGGYGNYTCIDHGQFNGQWLTTCYAHQSAFLVHPGQQVSAGQAIGKIGSTGASTGPHLHFEVRLGGRPVDPRPWIE